MTCPTCGARRSIIRSKAVRPPIKRSDLSPPPMRRASPPARIAPTVGGIAGSVVIAVRLAAMAPAFLGHEFQTLVEDDALGSGQGEETLALGPTDQREA